MPIRKHLKEEEYFLNFENLKVLKDFKAFHEILKDSNNFDLKRIFNILVLQLQKVALKGKFSI